jgi:hypothetical protein
MMDHFPAQDPAADTRRVICHRAFKRARSLVPCFFIPLPVPTFPDAGLGAGGGPFYPPAQVLGFRAANTERREHEVLLSRADQNRNDDV